MAKINWQNTKHRHAPQDYSDSKTNQYDVAAVAERLSAQAELWPCKGKYQGTKLSHLPLDYLQWVGMNFDANSTGYCAAVSELERRTK